MEKELDLYKTLFEKSNGLYKDKGSKFISFAYPVISTEEIKEILLILKKEYYDARHICYAYVLGSDRKDFRAVDDGEPSSTAGKPILGQINSHELTNVVIFVIRYFGGTKLGVPGLINAYKKAALDAINNNVIEDKTVDVYFKISFDYLKMNDVMKLIKDHNLIMNNQEFNNLCSIDLKIRKSEYSLIKSKIEKIGEIVIDNITIS